SPPVADQSQALAGFSWAISPGSRPCRPCRNALAATEELRPGACIAGRDGLDCPARGEIRSITGRPVVAEERAVAEKLIRWGRGGVPLLAAGGRAARPPPPPPPPAACGPLLPFLVLGQQTIYGQSTQRSTILFRAGLNIDADGAPNAYHP